MGISHRPASAAARAVSVIPAPWASFVSHLRSALAHPGLASARSVGLWALLIIASYLLGQLGEIAAIPAPELLLPLLAGAALGLTGLVTAPLPRRASNVAQALVGVVMGSYLQPDALRSVAASALPLSAVTVASIALSLAAAALLARTGKVGFAEATLGMLPGGSAAIIACSTDLGADSRHVAFNQYLRVGLVALTAPFIAVALGGGTGPRAERDAFFGWPAAAHWVTRPAGAASLLVLAAICLLGAWLGRRVRLPSPILLGPMMLAAVVTFTHAWHGFAPVGALRDVVFTVIGLEVGLRFTPAGIRQIGRALPYVIAAIVGVCLLSGALAWGFGTLDGIPFAESYLATTPGGINAVQATAVETHSDVPLVSTVQSIRLFVVVLAAPPLIRWLAARRAAQLHPASSITVISIPANTISAEPRHWVAQGLRLNTNAEPPSPSQAPQAVYARTPRTERTNRGLRQLPLERRRDRLTEPAAGASCSSLVTGRP